MLCVYCSEALGALFCWLFSAVASYYFLSMSIWNDSGSGGREGSIWLFNSLNLIGFVNGHDPPRRKPLDLKAHRFFLREYSCIKTNGIAPAK